jgi:hypothetical protein
MKLLLPHRFKKLGFILAPLGLLLWILMQKGFITSLLKSLTGTEATINGLPAYFQVINSVVAILSFFGFLAGLYFIAFSKEPREDEMIQKTRMESFQFAALVQFLLFSAGFLFMLLAGEPGEGGMMLFFVGVTLSFWLCYIARFNYVLGRR